MKYKLTAKRSINVSQDSNNVVIPAGTELTAYDNNAYYDGATFDWTEYAGVFVAEGLDSGCGLDILDLQAEPGKSYKPKSKQFFRNVDVAPGGGSGSDAALSDAELMFSQYEQDKKLTSMNVAGCQQETIDALVNAFKNSGFADAAYDAETASINIQPEYDFDVTYHVTQEVCDSRDISTDPYIPIAMVMPDRTQVDLPVAGHSVFGEGTVGKLYKNGVFVKIVDLYQPMAGDYQTSYVVAYADFDEPGDYRLTIDKGGWQPNSIGDTVATTRPELAGLPVYDAMLGMPMVAMGQYGLTITVRRFVMPSTAGSIAGCLMGTTVKSSALSLSLSQCSNVAELLHQTWIADMHINDISLTANTNCQKMFKDCLGLQSIGHLTCLRNATNTDDMFSGCYSLSNVFFDDLPVSSDCNVDLSDCRWLSTESLQWLIDNPNLNAGEATIIFPAGTDLTLSNFDECKSRLESLGYTVEVASA